MKKTIKMIIAIMLVVATVLSVSMTTQAASNTNKWVFQADKKKTIYVGQTTRIRLTNSISGSTLEWKSNKASVATVDSLGNVTGKKAGTVKVTVSDGTHKSTCKVTVKAISKAKSAQLNYADGMYIDYRETYTFETLNGSAIKKIKRIKHSSGDTVKVAISGTAVTVTQLDNSYKNVWLEFTLEDGTKIDAEYYFNTNSEKEEAISIVEKAASAAGISTSSNDLEKAMFIYNWLGENCSYSGSVKTGHYYAIRTGKGNCSAYSEAVQLMGEVLGLQVVRIACSKLDHEYNGVRVNGKWYLMDTTGCTPWDFTTGNIEDGQIFLTSTINGRFHAFKVSSKSLADITFDNTEYDDPSVWAEYKSNYAEYKNNYVDPDPLDDDFWNS